MKNIIYIFALVAFGLVSCDENEVDLAVNKEEVKFGGLKVYLPVNYNESVLSLSLTDLQNEFYANNTGDIMKVKSSVLAGITLEEMNRIIDGILTNYPTLDSLTTDEIEKINVNFPDLNSDEIVENINVIDSFYTSLIRYDLVRKLAKTNSKSNINAFKVSSSSNAYSDYGLNSAEFWYIVTKPALASPIKKATEKANSLTESNYPESGKWRDKADAFRHAIWNVLICKYVGENKNKISDCTKIAEEFTTIHETGAEKPSYMTDVDWELDKKMDLHNNRKGREIFETMASIVKVGLFKVNRVSTPSEDLIVNQIKNKLYTATKISNSTDLSPYDSRLVYIID
jgi:hypothetical protein